MVLVQHVKDLGRLIVLVVGPMAIAGIKALRRALGDAQDAARASVPPYVDVDEPSQGDVLDAFGGVRS